MGRVGFSRFELRTTDITAARAFYQPMLLAGCPDVSALPEAAIARGARPHWLGHLGVADQGDLERLVAAFIDRGATQLGPARTAADGSPTLGLRDPGGAVLALCKAPAEPPRSDVVSHQLFTTNVAGAIRNYSELFGWRVGEQVDLGNLGRHLPFSYSANAPNVGVMADIAGRAQLHPHWLHYFRVAKLQAALDYVRAAGGVVVGPFELPGGVLAAACDDPQGAAFGLMTTPT